MSTASEIAVAIAGRIAGITLSNGYATAIGTRVYRGKRRLDESAIPCAVIIEGDDAPADEQRSKAKIEAHFMIEGISLCDPDNPNDAAHLMIADIKKAIFGGDLSFGGKVRDVRYLGRTIAPREDGMSSVATSVEISVTYVENLAAP